MTVKTMSRWGRSRRPSVAMRVGSVPEMLVQPSEDGAEDPKELKGGVREGLVVVVGLM